MLRFLVVPLAILLAAVWFQVTEWIQRKVNRMFSWKK